MLHSPNGQLLASCSEEETVKIGDVNTWELHLDYKSDHGEINNVTFSPNSKLLACESHCCAIKIFDCSTKQLIHNLACHGKRINSIEFSPDSQLIASGSSDKTVKIWSINTGDSKGKRTLEGHRAIVNSVSFSPNGKMLTSSSVEGTIKIWYLDSDQPHRNLEHHTRWAWSQENVGISIENSQWICYGGEKRLWLPIEYREARLALKGNVLALSNSRGSVSFLIQENWQETSNPKSWM